MGITTVRVATKAAGAPRPIRFGVAVNGLVVPAWQARCLEHLLALDAVELALVITGERHAPATGTAPPGEDPPPTEPLLWHLYVRRYAGWRSQALRQRDIAELVRAVPVVRLPDSEGTAATDGCGPRAALTVMRDLDFILWFADRSPGAAIRDAPHHGVWMFAFGSEPAASPAPVGFWEVYRGEPVTRAALLRRDGSAGGAAVLRAGYFSTARHSYVRNLDKVLLDVVDWPAVACRDLCAGVVRDDAEPSRGVASPHAPLSNAQVAGFLVVSAGRFAAAAFVSLCCVEQFNIGIIDGPIAALLDPAVRPPIRWLADRGRDRFIADPFALERGGRLALLFEGFDYRDGTGYLATAWVDTTGDVGPAARILSEPVHMSYPYLLEHDGTIYCIPETAERQRVALYRATAFPDRWVRVATLIDGFAAVDPTVFLHEGRWWLFCSVQGGLHHSTFLYAWYAPELTGPWTPHVANPLKTDVRGSRPAGTPFVHAGQLYRPAQDCSRGYGGGITLTRIVRLTPWEFREESVTTLTPAADSPYPDGVHTLSACGPRTFIDGKRLRLSLRPLRRAVRAALATALRQASDQPSAR